MLLEKRARSRGAPAPTGAVLKVQACCVQLQGSPPGSRCSPSWQQELCGHHAPLMAGLGLVLLEWLSQSCSPHAHEQITTGGKGDLMRCGQRSKRKELGEDQLQKKIQSIAGSLHNGTWLIFIHITENYLAIFSFTVTRKSTLNWSF